MGPEVKYVDNVDCTGYSLNDAVKKLEAAGLTLGEVTYEDGGKQKDIVLRQSPDPTANYSIAAGTKVDLVVSTGKTSYSYTLKIDDLPKNFKENYKVTLEASVNGVSKGSTTVRLKEYEGSWTVSLTGITSDKVKVAISIESADGPNIDDALVYTVDMVNKKDTVVVSEKIKDFLADSSSSSSSETASSSNPSGSGDNNNNNNNDSTAEEQ